MALLRYVFDHNQQVIGGLMVIILATAALLAMRMVAQEKSASPAEASKSGAADLDLGAIETAFKRVLAAQTGVPVAAVAAGATTAAAPTGDVSERDAKIQELAREIDRLTAELNSKGDGTTGFGGTVAPGTAPAAAPADAGQLETLQAKIAELEGKLTEYEIIEDDIADLSRFKEENAELRAELDGLKARAGGAAAPAPAAAAEAPVEAVVPASAPEAAAPAAAEVPVEEPAAVAVADLDPLAALEAELAAVAESAFAPPVEPTPAPMPAEVAPAAEAAAPAPAPAAAKSELDEAMMKEFASAVEVQKPEVAASSDLNMAVAAASLGDGSSILDDSVDTEKMIAEVSNLSNSTDSAEDVLAASLDTEKLLAEVGSLMPQPAAPSAPAPAAAAEAPAAPAAPAPAAAPVATAAAPAAPQPAAMDGEPEAKFEDDLLAEFKDSNDGGQG